MIEEIEEKRQAKSKDANGVVPACDSWVIKRWSDETKKDLIFVDIVYTDPSIVEKMDMSSVDLSTMTSEQLTQLKTALGL